MAGTNTLKLIDNGVEDEPVIALARSLKDGGVLDSPERLDRLELAVEQMASTSELLRKAVDFLGAISCQKMMASFTLPETTTLSIAKIDAPTQIIVPVQEMAKALSDSLLPVLKVISQRPEPVAPSVKVGGSRVEVDVAPIAAALEKSLAGMVERMQQPPAQVNFDGSQLAEVVGKAIGKSMERLVEKVVERMQPQDLTPVLKSIEALAKNLSHRPPQPKQKRVTQDYATGDWIVSTEE